MIAPTAPAVVALATFCANEKEPREISAMLPLIPGAQSDGDPARPQLTSVFVMPRDFVVPANSRPNASNVCVVVTDASKPWPFGTEESTSTPGPDRSSGPPGVERPEPFGTEESPSPPGPDRSSVPPVFEKLAWALFRSTAPTETTTS